MEGLRCRLEVNPQQQLSIRWLFDTVLGKSVSIRLTLKEFPDVSKIVKYFLFISFCINYIILRMFNTLILMHLVYLISYL